MSEELMKRLRERAAWINFPHHGEETPTEDAKLMMEAADAIEELQADNAALNGTVTNLLEQINDLASPRWISVTERLPKGADESGEICENVWLLFDDGCVYPGWMNGSTKKVYFLDDMNDVVMRAPISRVRAWQPGPKSPKEGEE